MNQFVFLPDKRSSKEEVVATLAAVVEADVALEYLAAPVALGVGMEAIMPASAQPRRVRGLEVVDVVEQSGAALVKVSRPGPAPEAVGGTFHPVVNYKMAVADVRFGRVRMTGSIGPAGTDFLKIVLRSSANGDAIGNVMATLRLKGSRQQVSAVSDSAGVVRFGLRAPAVQGAMLAIEPGFLPGTGGAGSGTSAFGRAKSSRLTLSILGRRQTVCGISSSLAKRASALVSSSP